MRLAVLDGDEQRNPYHGWGPVDPSYPVRPMYAVIATGGKQYRVEEGQRVIVERLAEDVADVELAPIMVVDGDDVRATPEALAGSTVTARVIGEVKGPKIRGFTYKNKSNQQRRWGHRQHLDEIEITRIKKG